MQDPKRLSFQAALLAMSAWVLGSILFGATYRTVGLGGIVVLLVTLVVTRIVVANLQGDEDD